MGTRGVRIDDVHELDPSWYPKGDETILLTAGASAPEDLVSAICRHFVERHGATLHLADVFEESVEFGLPLSLKRLMQSHGIDPGDRKVKVEPPVITEAEYGMNAVALTVSAKGD